MRNIDGPTRIVSFEDALRNLAAKLTGTPATSLPRTQEGVVQYMAERIPSVNALAEAVTREVVARMNAEASSTVNAPPVAAADTPKPPPAAEDTPETETGAEEPIKPKSGRRKKTDTNTEKG